MSRYVKIWISVWLTAPFSFGQGPSSAQSINLSLALRYFQEAEAICRRDHGQLWGISLCGPMLFVDPASRTAAANQRDPQGKLTPQGNVYIGRLPPQTNIANTAVPFQGLQWTMLQWPLPEDKTERTRLMVHELWHRVQSEIGLPGANPSNPHLGSLEGRIWLQLEWRALREALRDPPSQRRKAVEDALIFRAHRRQLFPQAAVDERSLEMHEGLAEYTGVKLAAGSHREAVDLAVRSIDEASSRSSFVRSFAYVSGPAYGILLDEAGANWRMNLKSGDDLGVLLQRSLSIKVPADSTQAAAERSRRYDGESLRASETEREKKRQVTLAEYRVRLVDGPVLAIPLREVSVQFDPNNLIPLEGLGTVYPTIQVKDVWGTLNASRGALLNPGWTELRVPAPRDSDARPLQGDGWTLELASGWKLAGGERKSDYVLKPESK